MGSTLVFFRKVFSGLKFIERIDEEVEESFSQVVDIRNRHTRATRKPKVVHALSRNVFIIAGIPVVLDEVMCGKNGARLATTSISEVSCSKCNRMLRSAIDADA